MEKFRNTLLIPALLYSHTCNFGCTESPRGLQAATVPNREIQEYTKNSGIY